MTSTARGVRAAPIAIPASLLAAAALAVLLATSLWVAYGPLGWGIERVALATISAGVLALTLHWRLGVYLVLAYLLVEGLVINALYPASYPLLAKDGLIAGTYLGFAVSLVVERRRLTLPRHLLPPFLMLTALVVLGAFHPSGVDPLVSLVGARVLLFYVPLVVLGFYLGRERRAGLAFLLFILATSLPVTLLGIAQYLLGPQAVAELGPAFARAVWIVGPEATEDLIYRPASTFGFVGHFGQYLFLVVLIAFGMVHARVGAGARLLAAIALAAGGLALVLQSQRTIWVLLPIALAGTYLLQRDARGIARGLPVAAAAILAAALVGAPVLANRLPVLTGSDAYAARLEQTIGPLGQDLLDPIALVGHGTGTALGAIRHVTGGDAPAAFEGGWYAPFYMFGIWGLLAYLWLYGAVLRVTWPALTAGSPERRPLAAAAFMYLLLIACLGTAINHPPVNVHFWLVTGVLAAWGSRETASVGQDPPDPDPVIPQASRRERWTGNPAT